MFYIYAIKSTTHNRIYVGLTSNLKTRIREHNAGKTKSTKFYKPWILLYHETVESRTNARNREKYLKSGYGKEFLKTIAPVAHKDRAAVS